MLLGVGYTYKELIMIEDTIAAVATPMAPASIGIIRISGEKAIQIVDNIFIFKNKRKKLINVPTHTLHYGYIIDPKTHQTIDEVLVSIMRGPNSFTREDVVEINAHGGIIVVQKILKIVLNQGVRLAEPGEFTKRAFLNGRIDLSQAEAVIDIINSSTEMALDASINQLKGSVSHKMNEIKNLTLQLIAHIEASIDYPEYDIEELSNENILHQIVLIQQMIKLLLNSYDDGKRIKEGIRTTIIGKTNVGKSSLLNALIQEQRAIVTDVPGTTRDVLEEYMNINGVPLRLIDTAGIRETEDFVEKIGVERSKEKINEADLILFMIDASNELTPEDFHIIELIKDKKVIILMNKIDLEVKVKVEELELILNGIVIIPISVKTSDGMEILSNHIRDMFMMGNINFNDYVYITNVRHKTALEKALTSIDEVINSLSMGMTEDFLAIDLKNVYEAICEITGDSVKEDLIKQIFSQFCLGK